MGRMRQPRGPELGKYIGHQKLHHVTNTRRQKTDSKINAKRAMENHAKAGKTAQTQRTGDQ